MTMEGTPGNPRSSDVLPNAICGPLSIFLSFLPSLPLKSSVNSDHSGILFVLPLLTKLNGPKEQPPHTSLPMRFCLMKVWAAMTVDADWSVTCHIASSSCQPFLVMVCTRSCLCWESVISRPQANEMKSYWNNDHSELFQYPDLCQTQFLPELGIEPGTMCP